MTPSRAIRSAHRRHQNLRHRLLLLLWGPIVFLISVNGHAAEPPSVKRVLLISTGTRFSPGFALVDRNVLEALRKIEQAKIELHGENLDLIRFPTKRLVRIFTDYLKEKYADQPPDLIILVYIGKLGVAETVLRQLFPATPVILAGYTEEEIPPGSFGSLVTGIAQRVDARRSLELILHLQPETRRIVVIGGTADVDRDVINRVKEATRFLVQRVEFDFWDDRTMADLREAVTLLPPQTAILYTRLFQDAAGQSYISSEVGQWIGQAANVPVYLMTESSMGTGAMGGFVASTETLGRRAGELARLILTGTAAGSVPFEIRTDTLPVFDWRALKRWGVKEERLPPNSVVRFRPESLLDQYRWYIIAAFIVFCLQSAMIVDLRRQHRRRARTQSDLEESQQMMELASNAGGLGLWSRPLAGGDIWLNAPMRILFGFGADETVRFQNLMERVHPDDRAPMLAEVQRAQTAGLPFQGEFRIRPVDGTERWVLAKGRTATHADDSIRRMGVVLDITDRKRSEEELRESEERFRSLADAAPVMIWMSGTDKLCTFFNKGWLDFTGRTLAQECGNGWSGGVHEEDFHHCLDVYFRAFDAREAFTMEYRLRRHDGQYRWIVDQGVPRIGTNNSFLGYVGIAMDITERRHSAEALEKERKFLRQVIDIDPNFVFAKDREGRFTLANKALADAYGTTVENLIGKTDRDFNPNRDEVECFRRMDREVIDTLQERFIPEERITDAHGNIHWVQTVKRPIAGSDSSETQVLGSSTDITRRKETELELQEQRAELAHVARISIMGELAASLAHELNQPLTAILSNAQAALRFLSAKPFHMEEVREILQDIVQDNSRAGEVIRRMRALVKKEALEFNSLDLAGLIRDVATLLHSDAILHNVQLTFGLDDKLPPVRGDKVQLQQVVLNLMLNAFDAMKECPIGEREVKLHLEGEATGLVRVSVSDRGGGLSGDKLDRIFQPFYTTKREGLGMGLSICRSIIETHGGRLWAENNPDLGATFYFTVPVAAAAMDENHSIEPRELAVSFK